VCVCVCVFSVDICVERRRDGYGKLSVN
jgi:hypothetical protein